MWPCSAQLVNLQTPYPLQKFCRSDIAGGLVGRSVGRGDSVCAVSNPDSLHVLHASPVYKHHDGEGELLPGGGCVGVCGGGVGLVPGVAMTTFTPIVSPSA